MARNTVQVTKKVTEYLKRYIDVRTQKSYFDKEMTILKQKIRKFMLDNQAQVIDCGSDGQVLLSNRLSVNVKYENV